MRVVAVDGSTLLVSDWMRSGVLHEKMTVEVCRERMTTLPEAYWLSLKIHCLVQEC